MPLKLSLENISVLEASATFFQVYNSSNSLPQIILSKFLACGLVLLHHCIAIRLRLNLKADDLTKNCWNSFRTVASIIILFDSMPNLFIVKLFVSWLKYECILEAD